MPGIVAIFSKMKADRASDHLNRMVATLRHERSYAIGNWRSEDSGVYVGWAARPSSFLEKMPVRNEDGSVVLVFSGEDFPAPGTQQQLRQQGHRFEERGPSYLAHIYEDDKEFPAGLNGRFHGVLFDQNRGTAAVFNDLWID